MWRFWLAFLLAWASTAQALPLQTIGTFCGLFPDQCRKGTESLLAARGIGTDAYYVIEVDPATGEIPVDASFSFDASVGPGPADADTLRTTEGGREYGDSTRNVYSSVNVTTGAWVQVIASTANEVNWLAVFDSCGQVMEIGLGAVAAESRVMTYGPGGIYGVPLNIPAGSRVSLRAISGNCTTGEVDLVALQ